MDVLAKTITALGTEPPFPSETVTTRVKGVAAEMVGAVQVVELELWALKVPWGEAGEVWVQL